MRRHAMMVALLCLAIAGAAGDALAKPPHCPPGHARKGWCSPGETYRLPPGIAGRDWDDWDRARLPAPRDGRRYVVVDGDLFLILDATREVVEAFGALERLLRN